MVHTFHSSYGEKPKIGGLHSRQAWAKSETLSPKQPEHKALEAWLKLQSNLASARP
jgi:hypothetical protein